MISVFIREQQVYSRDELQSMFFCSEMDIIRIIKRLKSYQIIKSVKNKNYLLNITDLSEIDMEIDIEDESNKNYYFIFTFVGIIIVEGIVLKCYPKYLNKTNHPIEELKQIIKVIQKYNSKEQIINMYNNRERVKSFNRLSSILFLMNDYFENGVYTNTQNILETNGVGEIDWDRTINNNYPYITNDRPFYMELKTKRRVNDDMDYIKRLHECILTLCSKELEEGDLLQLFDIQGLNLSDESLEDLGDEDYILYNLQKEINVQFNTRKQDVLKTMEMLILNKGTIDDYESFSIFGTSSFNLVWEKVCSEVLNNQLHIPLNLLGLENIVIPKGVSYNLTDELIDIIEKPKWFGFSNKGSEFKKTSDKTLTPDSITIYKHNNSFDFIIFDAKYYTLQLESDKALQGQPGISDIIKQYMYQLAYQNFIKANGFNSIKNCFLMPTENESLNGVIKKGSVKMDILAEIGLEDIQVRELYAPKMFSYYLANMKVDISILDL